MMPQTQIASNDINVSHQSILEHLWYKFLNLGSTNGLFLTSELAERGECTNRTVYSFLKYRASLGEITVENRGRNGIFITMLEKGWELTKLFMKTPFLAYFRDKHRIPYINTSNTPPHSGDGDPETKTKDRIEKICARFGLTPAQVRAIKDQVKKFTNIKSLGGLVMHLINKIKSGVLKPMKTSKELEHEAALKAKLKQQASLDAKTTLQAQGRFEPKPAAILMTIEEMDAWNEYNARLSTVETVIYNKLAKANGF